MNLRDTLPLVIAHRGSSAVAPENTLAAISRACADGADGIEFDVRIARDRVPVVFHDSSLKRIAGVKDKVDKLTSGELASVDVGGWFNGQKRVYAKKRYQGEGIPTLESTLSTLSDFRGPIYVEIKGTLKNSRQVPEIIGEVLKNHSASLSLIVKSFDFAIVPRVKQACPDVETAALFAPQILRLVGKEEHILKIARQINAGRLSIHSSLATSGLMDHAANAGLPVAVWTVDEPAWLEKSRELGIESLITNDPERLLAARRRSAFKTEKLI